MKGKHRSCMQTGDLRFSTCQWGVVLGHDGARVGGSSAALQVATRHPMAICIERWRRSHAHLIIGRGTWRRAMMDVV